MRPSTKPTSSRKVSAFLNLVFATKGQVSGKAGIRINNTKFIITTFDDDENAAYLKSDVGGACLVKTKQCILVGIYNTKANPKQTSGNCNNDVAKVAGGLLAHGY